MNTNNNTRTPAENCRIIAREVALGRLTLKLAQNILDAMYPDAFTIIAQPAVVLVWSYGGCYHIARVTRCSQPQPACKPSWMLVDTSI